MDTLTLAIKKTLIEGPRSENLEILVEAKDIAHRLANNYTLQADDLRTKAVCMGNLMQMLKNEADKCARLRAAQVVATLTRGLFTGPPPSKFGRVGILHL